MTFKEATEEDIAFIAANLRRADFEEYVMATGRSPVQTIHETIVATDGARLGILDGEPVCLFGVTPLNPTWGPNDGGAAPWMLGTDGLTKPGAKRHIVRYGRQFVRGCAAMWGWVYHRVYAKNEAHVRFLEGIGCRIGPAKPFGPFGAPFREFTYGLKPTQPK